jgi:hypothetical protein
MILDVFKQQGQGGEAGGGISAGLGSGKAGAGGNMEGSGIGGNLKKFMGHNPDSEMIGEAAMKTAAETSKDVPILDKVQDYSQRYTKGKDSNLFQFIKDTKEGNYAGSLGYASKLAKGAQEGARPIPLIQLDKGQQPQPYDRYGQMYRRQRGY